MSNQFIVGTVEVRTSSPLRALTGWVRLEDVTMIDAPSRVCAQSALRAEDASMPLGYRLDVDPPVEPARRYAVRAELIGVDAQGRTQSFGATRRYPWAPSQGARPLNLVLDHW